MAFRSQTNTFYTSTAGVFVAPVPAGVVAGDAMVAYCASDNAGNWGTAPTGWTTLLGPFTFDSSGPDGQNRAVYWRSASGSEPSNYTFTSSTGPGSDAFVVIAAFSGASLSAPTNWATTVDTTAEVSGFVFNMTGITASSGSDIAWFSDTDQTSSTSAYVSYSAVTGYTTQVQSTNAAWLSVAMGTRDTVSAGATGTLSTTTTQVSGTVTYGLGGLVIEIPTLSVAGPVNTMMLMGVGV